MTATSKKSAPVVPVSLVSSPSTPSHAADAAALRAWIASAAAQYRGDGMRSALRAIALASVCPSPTNVLLIGPPGTAKSAVCRAWSTATGARLLARTLSPWTDAADLLGPVDVAALTRGELVRATSPTRATMTDADLVLLDEFPRAAPGIRALCLSALSDRLTPDDAPVTAHVILAGANTRLTSEEDAAAADRFALRVAVPRLVAVDDVRAVIFRRCHVGGTAPTASTLPALPPGIVLSLRAHAASIVVPDDVADAVASLVLALRQPPPSGASYPDASDRRWEIACLLLCASAVLAGRASVEWADLVDVLPLVLDDGEETRPALRAAIDAAVPRWVRSLADVDAACLAAVERARRVGGVVDARKGDGDAHTKVEEEFDALLAPLRPYGASVVTQGEARIDAARDAVVDAYATAAAAYAAHRKATR